MILNSIIPSGGGTEIKTATAKKSDSKSITFTLENGTPKDYWLYMSVRASYVTSTARISHGYRLNDTTCKVWYHAGSNTYSSENAAVSFAGNNMTITSTNYLFGGTYTLIYYY